MLFHGESHMETRSPTVCGTPRTYPAKNPAATSARPMAGYEGAAAREAVERQEQAGEDQRRAHISLQKEERDGKRDADRGGQRVFDRRNIEMAGEGRERGARFARMAQHVPGVGEIAGEEEDQQQADDLHRLEAEQVHLGVAGSRARTERDQQGRKHEARDQRNEAELAEEAAEIERGAARRAGRIR